MLVQYPLRLCECDLYNLGSIMMLNYYLPAQPLKTSGAMRYTMLTNCTLLSTVCTKIPSVHGYDRLAAIHIRELHENYY